ncbi:hypothetical protein OsI_34185 [Oryza sativa Indica Group]|uniref:K Homology domain-containing protein n=1 Tax=Oryza sativa subsp. indica TaxID=39946 RepID=B8BHP4_ORYSI|nr:hypothetical protein OsI_34185 [Oryza sativa Indica Group]
MARRAASRAVGALRSDGSIQGRGGRAGGSGAEDARHVFDELLRRGRGASIYGLNRALADVARDSPAAAVSRYNRMARAGADEVTPDLCTYGILIGCCCRAGRLDLGFAALGNVIKKGFRVDAIAFTPLLKGLCADKRTSDAMDIVLRRMTELGCIPNVFSYNILLKGLHCKEGRVIESEKLFELMGTVAESPIRGGIFSVCVNSEVQTGACGQVKEVGKNASEERLIVVSSQEIPDDPVSPTIEALILLHSKVSTLAENHQLTTRLVVPSNKVGCILGEGGKVITEMRRRTGAEIRVYSKADKPKYLSFDEELVQASVFSFTLGLQNLRTGPAHDPYTVYPVEYFSKREYPSGSSKVAPSASYERYAATTRLPNRELPSSISPGADYMSCRSYLDQVPTDRYSNRVTLQLGLLRAGNSNVQQLGITRAGNSNAYDYTEAAELIHGREDYRRLSGLTGYGLRRLNFYRTQT